MDKSLLIVESPAKAKTINKYLGSSFVIMASMGHVKDLPKTVLGVDIEDEFTPTFKVLDDKKKIVDGIKSAAKKVQCIYLAADPDREGEAICYHLSEELSTTKVPIKRVLFNEITKNAIRSAIENPGEVDINKVDAQLARRIIDRIVGYQVSPLLWKKVKRGLSAGRVQSVALRMICDREAERNAFVTEEYWSFAASLKAAGGEFNARLTKIDGKKAAVGNETFAREIEKSLKSGSYIVSSIEKREQLKKPAAPYITSKLQQDAARFLHFPVKKTMSIAQNLYEGLDIGKETVGLITYMRTDSCRIANEALEAVRSLIKQEYGNEYIPEKPNVYPSGKGAQEAHEAIRPTDLTKTPESIRKYLTRDQYSIYKLIYSRFVASQMTPARFDLTKVKITSGIYELSASGSVLRFSGYLKAFQIERGKDDEIENDEEIRNGNQNLPNLSEGELLNLQSLEVKQNFTEPPSRYSEGTLVKALEENGIGRPSTYATILSIIQNRSYVIKEKGYFVPTPLGTLVCNLLISHFPSLFDLKYTAKLEERLDEIEEGKVQRLNILSEFYKGFSRELGKAHEEMDNIRKDGIKTEEKCPECNSPVIIKFGKFGQFMACSSYPECKFTKPVEDTNKQIPQVTEFICEKCNGKMVLRKGRYGNFLGCENYPKCKNIKNAKILEDGRIEIAKDEVLEEKCPDCGSSLTKKRGRFGIFIACSNYPKCKYIKKDTIDVPCPRCGKALVKRWGKNKKQFYGCSQYPECDFLTWDKPVVKVCPKCKSPFMLQRIRKTKSVLACHNESCGYEEPIASSESEKSI